MQKTISANQTAQFPNEESYADVSYSTLVYLLCKTILTDNLVAIKYLPGDHWFVMPFFQSPKFSIPLLRHM